MKASALVTKRMKAWSVLALALFAAGCIGDPGAPPTRTPGWEGHGSNNSFVTELTGEGEAEISGSIRAISARDVTVEVYIDRECPGDDFERAEHLASRTLELGDVDGEKEYETTLRFKADPVFPRVVAYQIHRANNIASPFVTGCLDVSR